MSENIDDLKKNMNQAETFSAPPLLITAHIGNWEYLGHWCSLSSKRKFYALAKPVSSPFGRQFLRWLRLKLQIKILWTGKNNFQREMIRVLQRKDWTAFLMDQKPQDRKGPRVDFFGRPTEFVGGPAKMAIRFRSPVMAAFCIRIAPFHYKLVSTLLPIDHQQPQSVDKLTQTFATHIEQIVKKHPEQWCWSYKRWKDLT